MVRSLLRTIRSSSQALTPTVNSRKTKEKTVEEDTTQSVVNETEVVDTSSTESTPVESESTGDELGDIMSAELAKVAPETDETESAEGEENNEEVIEQDTEDDQKQSGADKRKEQLQAEIRDFVAQKNQAAQELNQVQAQLAQLRQQSAVKAPQNVEEYLDSVNPETGDYYTRQEVQIELLGKQLQQMESERQAERHLSNVRASQGALENDAKRVLVDFPQFDERSPEYNKELSERIAPILEANLITDPVTGQVVGVHTPMYQLYQTAHEVFNSGSLSGVKTQSQATSQMMRNVDAGSGLQNINQASDEKKFIDSFFK